MVKNMERPILNKELDSKTFRNFYFLKEELVKFCKENGLPVSGGKIDITDRIVHYLDTGEILSASREKRVKFPIVAYSNRITVHKYGHMIQSMLLGTFMLIPGIISVACHSSLCAPIYYCLFGVVLTGIIACILLTDLFFYIKI